MDKSNKRWLKISVGIVSSLVFSLVIVRLFWLQPFREAGRCMDPTLQIGDLLFVNKLSYINEKPQTGDVVLFDPAKLPIKQAIQNSTWIKRIAGIPGETISIHPPYIYVNSVPLTTPEIFQTISEMKDGYKGYILTDTAKYPDAILKSEADVITLSENEYFLVGDNATNSLDSRHLGIVPRSAILGKILYIASPGNRRGSIK